MHQINGILTSYGTGPMGRLGSEGLSKSSPSTNSRSEPHETLFSDLTTPSMQTRALLRSYERYKDPAVGCDQHFLFYKRAVPLSCLHARPNSKNKIDHEVVDKLVHLIANNGWSDYLGCITVCDDSIVPSNGPGTRIRSHLLTPTFSIVDGHVRIEALKQAKEKGHSLPDTVVVEVAVPDAHVIPEDTETNLIQLAIRLNRASGKRTFTDNKPHKDLRRIDCIRRFLKTTPEFESMSVDSLGSGLVSKAACKAVECHAIPGDNVGSMHLERYVRAALLFNSTPEAYDIYKRETRKYEDGSNYVSIVTLSAGAVLRCEALLRVLIVECLCAHGNTQKAQIKKRHDTVFIKNIIMLYDKLKKTAKQLGFSVETFLSIQVSFQKGKMESQRSTLREAIVAAASSTVMCFTNTKLKKIVTTLQKSMKAAWKERQNQGSLVQRSTVRPSLSTVEKPSPKVQTSSLKDIQGRSQRLEGEETMSLSLAHNDQKVKGRSEDSSEESPKLQSDEEAELKQNENTFRDIAVTMRGSTRGQKRAGSPERLSILRRKVLKREGQQHRTHRMEVLNGEVDSRASHLHGHPRSGNNKEGNVTMVNKRNSFAPSRENGITAWIPTFLSVTHQARLHLSRRDVEKLRTELQDSSSVLQGASSRTWKELHKKEEPKMVRSCEQFVSFWSSHRAAVDEKGYTQIELPSGKLLAAVRSMLKSTDQSYEMGHNTSSDVGNGEGTTCHGHAEEILYCTNVIEQEELVLKGGEYERGPIKVSWAGMVVETALAIVSEWLGLNDTCDSKLSQESFLPNEKLRLKAEQRDARKPRLAFGLRRDELDKEPWHPQKNPSYMFLVSGDTGFPIWVWERTHVLLQSPDELLPLIAKSIKPQSVFVKPRSVFLCRGDIVHAFESTYGIDRQESSRSIAVMYHLVQCAMDGKKPEENEGWWAKYIVAPGP